MRKLFKELEITGIQKLIVKKNYISLKISQNRIHFSLLSEYQLWTFLTLYHNGLCKGAWVYRTPAVNALSSRQDKVSGGDMTESIDVNSVVHTNDLCPYVEGLCSRNAVSFFFFEVLAHDDRGR